MLARYLTDMLNNKKIERKSEESVSGAERRGGNLSTK